MYSVSAAGGVSSSDVPESGDGGDNNEEEEVTVLADIPGGGLQQAEFPAAALTATTSTATAAAVSSSVATLSPDVLSSLGVMLSPESIQMIANIFFEMGGFARGLYGMVVKKQFPSGVNERLSVTGRAIWRSTYNPMCRDFFVSRCLGEYHSAHRPGFIRSLPRIQVVSCSSDRGSLPLTGDSLLSFLSNLDSAIRSELGSIFDSCLGEVSVSLEGESLSAVSCEDFVDVLNIAGAPGAARSVVLLGSYVGKEVKKREIPTNRPYYAPVAAGRHMGGYGVPVSTHVGTSTVPVSVGRQIGGGNVSVPAHVETGTATVAAKRRRGVDSVAVPTHVDTRTVHASVWMPPRVDFSGGSVPPYVQYADSLGFELHPDSVILVRDFFSSFYVSATRSFSRSIRIYISTAMGSGLSMVGRFIWFTTYRELYLYNFISRCLSMYHCNYRPDFIRGLANIRVLSDCSNLGLQLSGGSLVSFLSRLDLIVRDLISCLFNSQWGMEVDKACFGLESGSLNGVTYESLIYVLDIAGVPESAFSFDQRRRECIRRRKEGTPESSSRITSVGTTDLGGDIAGRSLRLQEKSAFSIYQRPRGTPGGSSSRITGGGTASGAGITGYSLLLQERSSFSVYQRLREGVPGRITSGGAVSGADITGCSLLLQEIYGRSYSSRLPGPGPGPVSTVFGDSSSNVGGDVLVSTVGGAASSLGVLEGESFSPLSSSSSSFLSESVLDADVSSSSSESFESVREVESIGGGIVSALDVLLVGKSTSVSSSERPMVPTVPSSVSAAVGDSTAAAASISYFRGPKKSFMMRSARVALGVSTSGDVAAAPYSSTVPVDVGNVPKVAAATSITAEDVVGIGVRLEASLNRELPSLPPSAGESGSAAVGDSTAAAASVNYSRGPKKSFMMRSAMGALGVSTSSGVAAAPYSSTVPVDVDSVPTVAAATSITAEDVGIE
ncbi:hypothetical protein [Candidatus Ichthyocystis sparus]|uniref:hypothetical protein n=1 Tax=Candidatus Ichthyocystis sparus TaxID=1561004 RepID=UPI000B829B04|nr:hypothetical protein [Candidatus Ichthyocystis sparus]